MMPDPLLIRLPLLSVMWASLIGCLRLGVLISIRRSLMFTVRAWSVRPSPIAHMASKLRCAPTLRHRHAPVRSVATLLQQPELLSDRRTLVTGVCLLMVALARPDPYLKLAVRKLLTRVYPSVVFVLFPIQLTPVKP